MVVTQLTTEMLFHSVVDTEWADFLPVLRMEVEHFLAVVLTAVEASRST